VVITTAIFVDTIHRHLTRLLAGLENRRRAILLVIDVVDNKPFLRRDPVAILTIITLTQEVLVAALMVLVLARTLLKEGAAADSEVRAVCGKRVVGRHCYRSYRSYRSYGCSEVQQMIIKNNFASFFGLILQFFTNLMKGNKSYKNI
jgi:hypothetical protein